MCHIAHWHNHTLFSVHLKILAFFKMIPLALLALDLVCPTANKVWFCAKIYYELFCKFGFKNLLCVCVCVIFFLFE